MPAFGPTTRIELIRCLKKLGFEGPHSGRKHQFLVKGSLRLRIPNPHRSDIGVELLKRVLVQAGVSTAEWEQL